MKNILILGAGKSATDLIDYLLANAVQNDWFVTVGDMDEALAAQKIANHSRGKAVYFNVMDVALKEKLIAQCDIVASILPANLHYLAAETCLKYGKHLITPSYISKKERAMDADFKAKGLLFMGEMGLDPGIDHMTLMQMIDDIRAEGGQLQAVRSCCGALIAPEFNDNPWNYKFTWAPMNVVKAGQGTAQYLKDGKIKFLPYSRLFSSFESYEIKNCGTFEAYANRDSMSYIEKYGLEDTPTFVRCTLRNEGYCEAWNAFVQLGWTDDSYQIPHSEKMTYTDLLVSFLPSPPDKTVSLEQQLANFLKVDIDSSVMFNLKWLGLLEHQTIGIPNATPAKALLNLLLPKWKLQEEDRDMVVMLHKIDYLLDGEQKSVTSSLVLQGEDANRTALSKTVGLPMGILVKLVLTEKVQLSGVHLPLMRAVYEPVLAELAELGVVFQHEGAEKVVMV